MRLLDLFCGAGGAARGYDLAGWEVVGVDKEPQPNYPYELWKGEAVALLGGLVTGQPFTWRQDGAYFLKDFDAIHASPPCQAFSDVTPDQSKHEDLIAPIRPLLEATGLPWIMENVEGAPLIDPITLCGTSFQGDVPGTLSGGLRVIRHRLFESNVPLSAPPCNRHPLLYVPDKRRPHQGLQNPWKAFVQVTGGGNCSAAQARDAMGIWWMTKDELNEAIPPAFTHCLGAQLLAYVEAKVAA